MVLPAGGNVITALFASLLAGFALGQASPIIQFFVAGELPSNYMPAPAVNRNLAMIGTGGLPSNLTLDPAVDGNFALTNRHSRWTAQQLYVVFLYSCNFALHSHTGNCCLLCCVCTSHPGRKRC